MATKMTKEFPVHPYVQYMMDHYSPYKKWVESEGIPIISGSYVPDVRDTKLGDWKRRGVKGAYLSFSDQMVADAYICEIPPGGNTKPQRQLFEEIVLVASGRGATTIWYDGTPKRTFEWERGSVFAIPLNAYHQHFNATGSEPARYVALTSQPVAFELFRDPEFIFNTNYMFKDRFDPKAEDFFSREGKYHTEYYGGILHTNFIADIRKINLVPREKRGKGTRNMYIHMAGSAMLAHVSQFPVGRYKKAHKHGPGAHVCLLDSTGYTLMWDEGQEPKRYDWHEGSIVCPPAGTWHQHYNTGNVPCKFVALHANTAVQREEGGIDQIDFDNEDASLRKMYEEECKKNGVTPDMGDQ
ncbi:MAG TPA: ethanolamine ammonia lyase-activating protein [Candidatus Binatia bacterium]|jgi:mannose-6-phosphate isomerase-like protein (cupin superfamily)